LRKQQRQFDALSIRLSSRKFAPHAYAKSPNTSRSVRARHRKWESLKLACFVFVQLEKKNPRDEYVVDLYICSILRVSHPGRLNFPSLFLTRRNLDLWASRISVHSTAVAHVYKSTRVYNSSRHPYFGPGLLSSRHIYGFVQSTIGG